MDVHGVLLGIIALISGYFCPVLSVNTNVCKTYGSGVFQTFNGTLFFLKSTCPVTLTSFTYSGIVCTVTVQRGETGTLNRVEILVNKVMTVIQDGRLTVEGNSISLPYEHTYQQIYTYGIYTKMRSKVLPFSTIWRNTSEGISSLWMQLDQGLVDGMTGTCGRKDSTDNMQQLISGNVISGACLTEDPKATENKSCKDIISRAIDCGFNNQQLFTYQQLCYQNMFKKVNTEAKCAFFQEFAHMCKNTSRLQSQWRKVTSCPEPSCPGDLKYSEQDAAFPPTCTNPQKQEDVIISTCLPLNGMVLNNRAEGFQAIMLSDCPCVLGAKTYPPGSNRTSKCQSCKCVQGKWLCSANLCPPRCHIEGRFVTTFDGRDYSLPGKCTYVAARGINWTVAIEFSGDVSITKTYLNVYQERYTFSLGSIKLEDNEINDLSQTEHTTVFWQSSMFIQVQTSFGMKMQVQVSPEIQIYLYLPPNERTTGLCGTYNNNTEDDFTTSSGIVENSALPFALSWTKGTCRTPDLPICLNTDKEVFAEEKCSYLRNTSSIFASCYNYVPVTTYDDACIQRTCQCTGALQDCLCVALGNYAKACARQGIVVGDWRKETGCTHTCNGNLAFTYDMRVCNHTCRSLSGHDPTCDVLDDPVEGCGCLPGTLLNNPQECSPKALCNCHYQSGPPVPPGPVVIEGRQCMCENGHLQCSEACACPPGKICVHCAQIKVNTAQKTCDSVSKPFNNNDYSCTSGCYCPQGLYEDHNGGCVTKQNCTCEFSGNVYASGQTVETNCRTCICRGGLWDCKGEPCPGMCEVFGNGQYQTFDSQWYRFDGHCQYTLVKSQDAGENHFKQFAVRVESVPCCDEALTCSRSISVDLQNEVTLTLRDMNVTEKPLAGWSRHVTSLYSVQTVGLYLIISVPKLGLTVIWDKHTRIKIELQAQWKGKVRGLCGDFDGKVTNDFLTSSSSVVFSALEFGNSWKTAVPPCSDMTTELFPCERHSYCSAWAQRRCMILHSDTFKECHLKVDPAPYYQACILESCSCEYEGKFLGFCTAVAAYAEACSTQNVCIDWRTPDLCPVYCDYYNKKGECSWHYEPCGQSKICGKNNLFNGKLEGCYPRCPNEKPYYDENTGNCSRLEECTCDFNNTVITPGQKMNIYNQHCECIEGEMLCGPMSTTSPTTSTSETTVITSTTPKTTTAERTISTTKHTTSPVTTVTTSPTPKTTTTTTVTTPTTSLITTTPVTTVTSTNPKTTTTTAVTKHTTSLTTTTPETTVTTLTTTTPANTTTQETTFSTSTTPETTITNPGPTLTTPATTATEETTFSTSTTPETTSTSERPTTTNEHTTALNTTTTETTVITSTTPETTTTTQGLTSTTPLTITSLETTIITSTTPETVTTTEGSMPTEYTTPATRLTTNTTVIKSTTQEATRTSQGPTPQTTMTQETTAVTSTTAETTRTSERPASTNKHTTTPVTTVTTLATLETATATEEPRPTTEHTTSLTTTTPKTTVITSTTPETTITTKVPKLSTPLTTTTLETTIITSTPESATTIEESMPTTEHTSLITTRPKTTVVTSTTPEITTTTQELTTTTALKTISSETTAFRSTTPETVSTTERPTPATEQTTLITSTTQKTTDATSTTPGTTTTAEVATSTIPLTTTTPETTAVTSTTTEMTSTTEGPTPTSEHTTPLTTTTTETTVVTLTPETATTTQGPTTTAPITTSETTVVISTIAEDTSTTEVPIPSTPLSTATQETTGSTSTTSETTSTTQGPTPTNEHTTPLTTNTLETTFTTSTTLETPTTTEEPTPTTPLTTTIQETMVVTSTTSTLTTPETTTTIQVPSTTAEHTTLLTTTTPETTVITLATSRTTATTQGPTTTTPLTTTKPLTTVNISTTPESTIITENHTTFNVHTGLPNTPTNAHQINNSETPATNTTSPSTTSEITIVRSTTVEAATTTKEPTLTTPLTTTTQETTVVTSTTPETTITTEVTTSSAPPVLCKDFLKNTTWPSGARWTEDCFNKTCHNGIIEMRPVVCPTMDRLDCPSERLKLMKDADGCCDVWKCDCKCELYGDPHYISFAGTDYDFTENCTYMLVEEKMPRHNFSITVDNFFCMPALIPGSCVKGIIVKYRNHTATLQLNNYDSPVTVTATMNQRLVQPPYEENGFRFETSDYQITIYIDQIRSQVSLDPYYTLEILLGMEYFKHNTQGQCGVCGGPSCVRRNGHNESEDCCPQTAYEWIVEDPLKPYCKDAPTHVPCRQTPPSPQPPCDAPLCDLLQHQVFQECNSDDGFLEILEKNCRFDYCHGVNHSICSSLEHLADQCKQKSICVPWRYITGGICDVTCPKGMIFDECRKTSNYVCHDGERVPGVVMDSITPGCFCPDNQTLAEEHKKICVSECTKCKGPLGEPMPAGAMWESNCHICTCNNQTKTEECTPKPTAPTPTCSADQTVITDCCNNQICAQKTCEYNGKAYRVGDKWIDHSRPCSSLRCTTAGIEIERSVCPQQSCSEELRVWDEHHCCYSCNVTCAVRMSTMIITVSNCTQEVTIPACEGHCPSHSMSLRTGKGLLLEHDRKCCRETSYVMKDITLSCQGYAPTHYTYKHITGCECQGEV